MPKLFTETYEKHTYELRTKVTISPYFGLHRRRKTYSAIWDTGATNSVISRKIAKELKLKPIDRNTIITANGIAPCNIYDVELKLNKEITRHLRVNDADLNGMDVLIGMDLIDEGDFSLVTDPKTGRRILTYAHS